MQGSFVNFVNSYENKNINKHLSEFKHADVRDCLGKEYTGAYYYYDLSSLFSEDKYNKLLSEFKQSDVRNSETFIIIIIIIIIIISVYLDKRTT